MATARDRDNVPRYLIVGDPQLTAETVLRVSDTTTAQDNEQAGLEVQQPDERTSTLVGDIRPVLSGEPERESAATLAIVAAGAEGNMRWGFVRDGADDDADLQLRQSPGVCGRRPDVLSHSSSATAHWHSPRMVSLIDGSLFLAYMNQTESFTARDIATGWLTIFNFHNLATNSDTWTNAALADGLGDWGFTGLEIDTGPFWTDWDVVQYPDTGELVAIVVGGYVSTTNPHNPIGAIYHSTDNGATWVMRTRLVFEGNNPLIELALGEEAIAVAMERTETGRLVVLMGTTGYLVALNSDDRGRTWTAVILETYATTYESGDSSPVDGVQRMALDLVRLRSGVIFGYQAIGAVRQSDSKPVVAFFWMTADGVTWSDVEHDSDGDNSLCGVAVVERPDGYPWVYAALHNVYGVSPGSFETVDELVQIAIATRDPRPGDDIDDLAPAGGSPGNLHHFHLLCDAGRNLANRPNAPAGELNTLSPDPTFDGFIGVGACRHRGQVVLATVVKNESSTTRIASVVVYRVDHHQPLQERLEPNVGDSIGAVSRSILGYGATWDCYQDPTAWRYTNVATGGSGAIVHLNADGGYWRSIAAAVQNYWSDTTLPWPAANHCAVLRAVYAGISGGSITDPQIGLLIELDDGSTFVGAVLQLEVAGNDYKLQLTDTKNGDVDGVTTFTDMKGKYLEVFIAIWREGTTRNVECYARCHDRTEDPDFLVGYTLVARGTLQTDASGTERINFGHISSSSTGEARWKTIQVWRGDTGITTLDSSPLAQRALEWTDNESENVRCDRGEFTIHNDSGMWNYMRPAQGISYPAQWVQDGVSVEWRGEAAVEGTIAIASRYLYGGRNLVNQSSPQAEWRSSTDGTAVEIVFDAALHGAIGGGGGGGFSSGGRTSARWQIDAIAFFGRNWPVCKVQFNATDDWSAPAISLRAGIPGAGIMDRCTHLWDLLVSSGYTITLGAWRVTCATPASTAAGDRLWRPHRWASKANGTKYYACFFEEPSSGRVAVIRIIDNDRDTLELAANPATEGIASPTRIAIISDRFAWDFRANLRDQSATTAYRYMRILIEECDHYDEDGDEFTRLGLIVAGHATNLGGAAWNYTISTEAGSALQESETGADFRVRNHAPRRTWAFDSPVLNRPNVTEARSSPDYEESRLSWAHFVDALYRVEPNGEIVALCFDGNAIESEVGELSEQLLADPIDLAPVRLINAGDMKHIGYDAVMGSDPGTFIGSRLTPRPLYEVGRVTFREVL